MENETDVDCGGNCSPCATGANCSTNADCSSGSCSKGVCLAPIPTSTPTSPGNGTQSGVCATYPCPTNSTCNPNPFGSNGRDCFCLDPGLWYNGSACMNPCPTCSSFDGSGLTTLLGEICLNCVQANVANPQKNCGVCCGTLQESSQNPCVPVWFANQPPGPAQQFLPIIAGNCQNLNISLAYNYLCIPCKDGKKDGTETDVDCGGSCPTKCGVGLHCRVNADCNSSSGGCSAGVCLPAASTSTSGLTETQWGIVVAVVGGTLLIAGCFVTFKWWIPSIGGDGAYDSAVAYTAANHEGVEMTKPERAVSIMDLNAHSPQTTNETSMREDEVYVS